MKHAGLQYHIVSGRSVNTEKEVAMFTCIKTDTKLTSNFHSDQLVSNTIIRLQAREILNNGKVDHKYKNSYLHEIYNPIKVTFATPLFHLSGFENAATNTNTFCNNNLTFSFTVVSGGVKLMRVLNFLIIVNLAEI